MRVLTACASFVLSLLLIEVGLGLFYPQRTPRTLESGYPSMFVPGERLPYGLRPGFRGRHVYPEFDTGIEINSAGYRGPELRTPGSAFRILLVGDSFTFGWGVEGRQTYARRLESRLANEDLEVVNAGFAACYHPDTYYVYLKERGTSLEPDLIVVGLFVGNDIDALPGRGNRWTEVDGEGLPLAVESADFEVDGFNWVSRDRPLRYRVPVARHSHVFQLVASAIPAMSDRSAAAVAGQPRQRPFGVRRTWDARTQASADQAMTLFRAMRRVAGDTPLVVMMIPSLPQLRKPAIAAGASEPQRVFSEFFREEGIPVLDLLPAFASQSRPTAFYYPRDQHWNAAGHALASRELARFLIELELVPSDRREATAGS